MNSKEPFVYILASDRNGTLYIGVTSDLIKRVWDHKQKKRRGFTGKYSIYDLVYYEAHVSMEAAILREKQMKKWERRWKIRLIEERNPDWNDLWGSILGRP
jgi:putative endonuclease